MTDPERLPTTLPHEGPLAHADASGASGSMKSGPGVRICLRLSGGTLEEIRFETCAFDAARPVAEALCNALRGSTPEDAARWTALDVARVAALAPGSAIARTVHFAKSAALQSLLARLPRSDTRTVCTCFHVASDEVIAAVLRHRVSSVEQLRVFLPATTGCGSCRPEVQRLIDVHGSRELGPR